MKPNYLHLRIDHYDPLLKENQTDFAYDFRTEEEILDRILLPYLREEQLLFNGKRIQNTNIRGIRIFSSPQDINTCVKIGNQHLSKNVILVEYTKSTILQRDDTVVEITNEFMETASNILRQQAGKQPVAEPVIREVLEIQSKRVFIVHGHDSGTRLEVELLVRDLDLEPVVLFKEADRGQTIIEKLERETKNVSYAIIIYSHCDDGKAKEEKELNPRVRQNVVFEHGMMCALLGRNRVVALVEEGVEIPGDLSGVVYKHKDTEGKWKFAIAKEMDAQGLPIDFSKIRI